MMMRTVKDICELVEGLADAGRLSEALEAVCDLVMDVISRETSLGRVLASEQLDQTCLKLGRRPAVPAIESRDKDQIVFVVTALYRSGGHSRVLLDLAAADPAGKFKILVTNLRHDYPAEDITGVYQYVGATSSDAIEVAPAGDAAGRMAWLQQRLSELRPVRTYLLQHNYDSIAIAAAQPELTGQLVYIHHCDHSFTLGVYLPHAIHVDLDPRIHAGCRDGLGLAGNELWPLTAEVSASRAGQSFCTDGHLKTCTSGATHKFDASHFKEHLPYAVTYPEIVAVVLKEARGRHLHIGQLSKEMLGSIQRELRQAGIDEARFIHVEVVPDLAEALIAHGVDAYIGSFPYGGGRATVEAMGAGIPLLLHSNYRSSYFSSAHLAYRGALLWRTADELAQHLRGLTPALLGWHAQLARRHYEEHHAPGLLSRAMRRTFASHRQGPSGPPADHLDLLQTYLDERIVIEPERYQRERERLKATLRQVRADHETEIQRLTASHEGDLAKLQKVLAEKEAARDMLTAELFEKAQQLEAMHSSRSWRMTAGLRAARETLTKLRRP